MEQILRDPSRRAIRHPFLAAIFALAIGFVVISELPWVFRSPDPVADCKLTESQIHQLWADTWLHTHDEEERVRMTKDWVGIVERMCLRDATAKPIPLPPELQKLVK